MGLFRSLVKNLSQQVAGQRSWTPSEVRELIDRKAFDEARRALDSLTEAIDDRDAVRHSLLGEVLFQQRDDEAALQSFRQALKLKPGLPSAHYGLSLLMAETGEFDSALRHAFFADSVEPNNARFIAQVGFCQLLLNNHQLAEAPLRRATLLMPQDGHVWNNLALVLMAKGQLNEAHDCFRLAVERAPTLGSARENLAMFEQQLADRQIDAQAPPISDVGEVTFAVSSDEPALREVRALEREGALQSAIDGCEALVLRRSDDAALVLELHRLYRRAGDPVSGIDALSAFNARRPEDVRVAGALGLSFVELQKYPKAEKLLRLSIEELPDRKDLLVGLAQALIAQERYEEASEWIESALKLEPESLEIQILRATNLANRCLYDEALAACEDLKARGTRIDSEGMALAYTGRFDEAESMFDDALGRQPNNPALRFQRANVRLLRRDFAGGWLDYAYRAYTDAHSFRVLPFPLWRGESIAGKRLLVLAEQGLGDQVMFASCLPDLVVESPLELVVESHVRIAPTLSRSFPQCRVISTGQGRGLGWLRDLEDVDFYVPLGDLPLHFRRSIDHFPSQGGFLKADPGRIAHWRAVLAEFGPPPYVGVSWKGGTPGTRSKVRTINLMDFAPLAAERAATWVCLQYGEVAEAVEAAAGSGFACGYWPEAIANLDEFAALVSALDLVVTVCNTTVHYAGACGRPVWILAPKVPEWRYGAEGSRMPWYPTAHVYRQQEPGNWGELMERVRRDWSMWSPQVRGCRDD